MRRIIFRRPPRKKPLWAPGKTVPSHTPEKGMFHVPEFFPASTAEKTTVDAGKNGPVPTGYFSLPEAGKNRRKTVKGLDFLTV